MSRCDEQMFVFVWKVENFRMSGKDKKKHLVSPAFKVVNFDNSQWFLILFHKECQNDVLSCALFRSRNDCGPQIIQIDVNILFINNLYSAMELNNIEYATNVKFYKGEGMRFAEYNFDLVNELEIDKNNIYVVCNMKMNNAASDERPYTSSTNMMVYRITNKNSLTLGNFGETPATRILNDRNFRIKLYPNRCFARTRFHFERRTFCWTLDDIFKENNSNLSFSTFTCSDNLDLDIKLYFRKKCKTENIRINIRAIKSYCSCFLMCKVSLLDTFGKRYPLFENGQHLKLSQQTEGWDFEIPCTSDSWIQEHDFSKMSILCCEISISEGTWKSMIEDVSYVDFSRCKKSVSFLEPPSSLKTDLGSLLSTNCCSDVTLKCSGRDFSTHSAILCARSPVFTAMFGNNMRERSTKEAEVVDVDALTMERFLKFMYSDDVDDLQFEEAINLYKVADKYQVISLRQECSAQIVCKLTVDNMCSALYLVDLYNDLKLKTAISRFIFMHSYQVFASKNWKCFAEQKPLLIVEILQDVIAKIYLVASDLS